MRQSFLQNILQQQVQRKRFSEDLERVHNKISILYSPLYTGYNIEYQRAKIYFKKKNLTDPNVSMF